MTVEQDSQRCVVPTHDEPPLAAPGLLVCPWHHAEAVRLLLLLPDLDAELMLALKHLRSPQAPKPEGSRGQEAPAAISSDVTAVRQILHMRLANLCSTVALEQKFHHPRNDVESMVTFLVKNAEWMSNSPRFADGWYLAVAELAQHARRTAFEARPAGNLLGPCPHTIPVMAADGRTHPELCGTPVRFDKYRWIDDPTYVIACPGCKTEDTLTGWADKMVGRINAAPAAHLTAAPLAMWLSWGLRRNIDAGLIRTWKSRGQLAEVGRDGRNRPLYDRAAAEAHARKAFKLEEATK